MKRKRTRNAIATAIYEHGMTQKELAKEVGVHPVSVNNWVAKGMVPHADTRARLEKVLGLTEEQMTGSAPPPSEDNGVAEADIVPQHTGPVSVTIKGHGLLVQMMVSIETARELLQTLMS